MTGEVGLVAPGKSDGGAKGISLVSDIEEKVMMMTMVMKMVGEEWAEMQALGRAHRTRTGKLSAEVGGMGLGGQG